MLVKYFIERYGAKTGKKVCGISKQSLELLASYAWPGNIRELQNVVERSMILTDGDTFSVDASWLEGRGDSHAEPAKTDSTADQSGSARLGRAESFRWKDMVTGDQRTRIEAALAEAGGRVAGASGAAARLGIPPSTLDSKIKTMGIDKHRFKSRTTI